MKVVKCLLMFVIFFTSCQSKKTQHHLKCCRDYCGMYTSELSRKADSVEVAKLMTGGMHYSRLYGEEKITKAVFAKSTVKLLDINKDFKDYREYKYHSCSATMTGDTVVVSILHDHIYTDFGGKSSKDIKIKYWESDFETSIRYGKDTPNCVIYNYKGSTPKAIPYSDIYYDYFQINQQKYEKGDTICGRIIMRGKLKDRVQIVGGSFKTIIF